MGRDTSDQIRMRWHRYIHCSSIHRSSTWIAISIALCLGALSWREVDSDVMNIEWMYIDTGGMVQRGWAKPWRLPAWNESQGKGWAVRVGWDTEQVSWNQSTGGERETRGVSRRTWGAPARTWESEWCDGCERKAELVKQWGPQPFGLAVCDKREREAPHFTYLMCRLNSMPLS